MARHQPFANMRPPRYTDTQPVLDPDTGEPEMIALQHLDKPLQGLADDIASRLVVQFLGFPDQNIPPQVEFPVHTFELSVTLCQNAARFFVMQLPRPDGTAIYTTEEIMAIMATSEGFWDNLEKFANEVNATGESLKNAKRVRAGSGSETASDYDSRTRKLSSEPTPSYEAITTDKAKYETYSENSFSHLQDESIAAVGAEKT